jgi:hypothetical protein
MMWAMTGNDAAAGDWESEVEQTLIDQDPKEG